MKSNRLALIVFILLLWGVFSIKTLAQTTPLLVKGGIEYGISGLALLEKTDNYISLLAVHDNKLVPEQPCLAIIKIENNLPQYFPLEIPFSISFPADLEAITLVPDNDSYMALSSQGKVYHFGLDKDLNQVSLINTFELPSRGIPTNLEGFALQKIEDKLVAIWGHRGNTEQAGILYWGFLDLDTYQIIPQGSAKITVPFPLKNVRHISDLKIDSAGIVYLSAAMDMGNNGPFESAIYVGGVLSLKNGQLNWRQSNLFPIYRIEKHKVEAIEIVVGNTGGLILGSDDENKGGYIFN